MRSSVVLLLLVTALVGCGGNPTPVGTRVDDIADQLGPDFELAPDAFSPDAVNFMIVGDWGRNGFFNQRNVGRAMGVTALWP